MPWPVTPYFKKVEIYGKIGLLFEIRHNLYYLYQGLRVMRFYFSVCPVPVAELTIMQTLDYFVCKVYISVRWRK